MKKGTKLLALLLACMMLIGLFDGCGNSGSSATSDAPASDASVKTEEPAPAEEPTPAEEVSADGEASAEEAPASTNVELPLVDEPTSLSVWSVSAPFYGGKLDDLGDIYILSVFAEMTNVTLDYTTISFAAGDDAFGVMIASGDYCDIISEFSRRYAKSDDNAIDEGILIDLADLINENCPNLVPYIEGDKDIRDGITTDKGRIIAFPDIRSEPEPGPVNGLGIRQDWLDALNLDTPTTYDQFHTVLKAFKDNYNATMFIPQDGVNVENGLASGYGIDGNVLDDGGMFVVDGVVKSALVEDGYKEFLTMINQWYSEGLIDPDFITYQDEFINSHVEVITSGENGVASLDQDSFVTLREASGDPNFQLAPLADLTREEGETLHFGQKPSAFSGKNWFVTTGCENPELVAQYCNFLYSDEAIFIENYGTEGYTFEYDADGNPAYTDFITNNPDTDMFLMFLTVLSHTGSPFPHVAIYDRTYYLLEDVQLECMYTWSGNTDYAYVIPTSVALNAEESEEFNNLFSDVSTLASENIMAFMIGERSLDEYDAFKADLKQMGIDRMIELYQSAYDRYIG